MGKAARKQSREARSARQEAAKEANKRVLAFIEWYEAQEPAPHNCKPNVHNGGRCVCGRRWRRGRYGGWTPEEERPALVKLPVPSSGVPPVRPVRHREVLGVPN